ncbi:MAG: glycosyltransferase family 4 protein, partial [Planctomycetota bacterium]
MHNILYVSHTSQVAGAEHSLRLLLDRLAPRFRPTVALPGTGPLTDLLDEMGVPYCPAPMIRLKRTRNPARLFRYFRAWRRAVRAVEEMIGELGIDLVHANSTTAHLFASPAARRAGVPSVWHVRDMSSPGGRLDRMMTRHAAAIVCISEAVRSRLVHPELAAAKTTVIHNGVDAAAFAPGDGRPVRSELGLDASAPVAGIVGQVVPWKGHDRFLAAAAGAAARVERAQFVVSGDNRFGDFPGILDGLRRQADRLGIGDRVHFLGWRDDPAAVMNALDVLVTASEDEPFGRVVVEAMACGKPVVGFRCGGPVEIVRPGETGLLVEPYDTGAMAAAIVRLLSDRA